jgi:hypothetical protein
MNLRGAAMLLVMLAGVVMICAPGYAQEVNVVKWNAMVGWTHHGSSVSSSPFPQDVGALPLLLPHTVAKCHSRRLCGGPVDHQVRENSSL